jgi:serine/threonine-protein kinase/endoribonuclease IRE1
MASSSGSGSVPSTLAPLVRTTHVESDPDITDDDAANQELYIIEPQSGNIFVMASPTSPLQRLPFSMAQLVDMSPFSFPGDDDGRMFVGKKETSLLLIELETGKVKATLNSECPWNPFEDLQERAPNNLDLDELESGGMPKEMSTPTEVFIGRTGE